MHGEDHFPAPSHQAHASSVQRWAPRLLRLYPRAWRDRYGDEVASVLAEHRVTYWTALDLVLGALDAHLHGDLLPRRLTSMAHRIRSSEIAIFCAFVLFCVAWVALRFIRDPLPTWEWETATAAHPALRTSLTILDLASLVATLAILVGGLPLLVTAITQAIVARRVRLLALFAVPLLAATALAVVVLADIPWSSVSQSGDLHMLQPIIVQFILVILPLVAVGGSAAAIATAIGHSEVNARLLRFALLPAGVATAALALGLLAAATLNTLIFTEAPQVSFSPPMQVADLAVMCAAVVLATFALRHGIQAAHEGQRADATAHESAH